MYYLDNFETALRWVGERYGDLLNAAERGFLSQFAVLPRESRALLVRLIMRKGDIFRESRIHYPEIGDLWSAATPLLELGWFDTNPAVCIEELFRLLTRAELAHLFDLLRTGARKQDALDSLRNIHAQRMPLSSWLQLCTRSESAVPMAERFLRVTAAPLCARFRILFFGNFRQEWSEFVLADLGVFRYEKVEFSADSRAFQTREEIEHLIALYECRRDFYDEKPLAQVLERLPQGPLGNEWLESRRAKLLFQVAQGHERAGEPDAAVLLYAQSSHPGARLRAIRMLELAGRFEEAQSQSAAALTAPRGEAERQKLLRVSDRLKRRLGGGPRGGAAKSVAERLDCSLPPPAPGISVEFAVLAHLSRPEAPVFYVENTLINSLFGLLFWDAVFAAVRGAFFHPFQSGPADLHSAGFQARRQPQIDLGFASLRDGDYRAVIRRRYVEKQGIQSPFVFWGALTQAMLDLALDCIPAAHLQRCFERLLLDLDENRSGLPDLIQFWPGERRYRMIEVKGPGDRVQDNQRRWMEYCATHDIPVAVCHARWTA